MSPTEPTCHACRQPMEEGLLVDHGHHNSTQPGTWMEGKPERSWWKGLKTEGREVWQITSYRCPRCGLLQNYARIPAARS